MIPYELNDDQKMFQETIRRMVKEQLAPKAAEVDEASEFPSDSYELFSEYGLPGINIPEEYDGVGADRLTCALVLEEMGKTCNTSAVILGVSYLANIVLTQAGSEDQKKRFLSRMATGESICAISLIEPGMPYEIDNITVMAAKTDNGYILNGTIPVISNADVADILIVPAQTDSAKGAEGIEIFIIEKDISAFTCTDKGELFFNGSRQACNVVFKDCVVPEGNLIAAEEGGLKKVINILEQNNFITAARSIGLAQGALDHAVEYARTRVQFGKPIIKFQGIQFMIADLTVRIQGARQLLYKACTEMEKGNNEAIKLGAMVKSYSSKLAMDAAVDAIQLFGGYGVTWEYPVARYYRNSKLTSFIEGTSEIHKKKIAELLLA